MQNKEDYSIFESRVFNLKNGHECTRYRIDIPNGVDDLTLDDLKNIFVLIGDFLAHIKERKEE